MSNGSSAYQPAYCHVLPRIVIPAVLVGCVWFVGLSGSILAQDEMAADAGPPPAAGPADAPAVDAPAVDAPAADAPGAGEDAGQTMNPILQFLSNPINLILISAILFMFLVVRPQQKQMRELQKSLADLKKNDRVVTASGIHGTVIQTSPGDTTVVLRIDENTGARMTVNRDSISKILNSEDKS